MTRKASASSNLSVSSVDSTGKIIFKCEKCDYTTDRTSNLRRHQESLHKEQSLTCCGSIFKTKYDIIQHREATHKGKLTCHKCDQSFDLFASYSRHMKNHDPDTVHYECSICREYSSNSKFNLVRHEKSCKGPRNNGQNVPLDLTTRSQAAANVAANVPAIVSAPASSAAVAIPTPTPAQAPAPTPTPASTSTSTTNETFNVQPQEEPRPKPRSRTPVERQATKPSVRPKRVRTAEKTDDENLSTDQQQCSSSSKENKPRSTKQPESLKRKRRQSHPAVLKEIHCDSVSNKTVTRTSNIYEKPTSSNAMKVVPQLNHVTRYAIRYIGKQRQEKKEEQDRLKLEQAELELAQRDPIEVEKDSFMAALGLMRRT